MFEGDQAASSFPRAQERKLPLLVGSIDQFPSTQLIDGFVTQITCLYDMDIVPDPPGTWTFNEVYLYEELMEADLHAIVRHHIRRSIGKSKLTGSVGEQVRSGQPLSDAHFQSFLYQTLCGLKVSVWFL